MTDQRRPTAHLEHGRSTPVPIDPGATIGILGGGQLGRMIGLAARRLGYRIVALDPDPDAPAKAVADRLFVAPYDDRAAALELADASDVVTYELEHIDATVAAEVATRRPLRPGLGALRVTQDRLAERRFLAEQGAPVAPWRAVHTMSELEAGAHELGLPCRLKAAIGGYDGRSQARLLDATDLQPAFEALGGGARPLLLERELDFDCELSVVCARSLDGLAHPYPATRNRHDAGILVESVAPAPVTAALAGEAETLAARLAEALEVVGLLTVELFLLGDGHLAVNELAPRVHNSGHWTLDACATSQFEQHVRAICGLPLGGTALLAPAVAMVNLLGTGPSRPARLRGAAAALDDPFVHLHVYDKQRVFERRKMGHVTVTAAGSDEALARARGAADRLRWADDELTDLDRAAEVQLTAREPGSLRPGT